MAANVKYTKVDYSKEKKKFWANSKNRKRIAKARRKRISFKYKYSIRALRWKHLTQKDYKLHCEKMHKCAKKAKLGWAKVSKKRKDEINKKKG